MLPTVLLALTVSSALFSSPIRGEERPPTMAFTGLSGQTDKDDERVASLLKRIEKYKDRSNSSLFESLAKVGTKKAFKGLKKSITWLREERATSAAYRAFAQFKGVDSLEEDAIEFLAKQAIGKRRRDSAPVAAATLAKFGDAAVEAAELVAEKASNPEVRWKAIEPLLKRLGKRGDAKALGTILRCARPALDQEIKDVAAALAKFKSVSQRKTMIEALENRKTGGTLRLILMDHFQGDTSEGTVDALLSCLSLREPRVQRRAVEILSTRTDVDKARVRLWSLLDANDPQLRLVSIEGLGRMSGDDERWRKRLMALTRDNDALSRRGAARALAFQPTADAASVLFGMVDDDDWRVRLEVIRQLGLVRDVRSVSLLIQRMGLDTGRLRRTLALSLRRLTGEDHGNSPDRWALWWRGEGGSRYELPTETVASARNAKLEASRAKSDSAATFYGLPVYSDRVAFVFDTSGSMNAPTLLKSSGAAGAEEGARLTAMTFARNELLELMKRLPDGAHCNIIFFSHKLDPWKRKLTELTQKSRKKALKFIEEKNATGGTALYDAIIEAFDDENVDTIYILSDGLPSAGELTDPEDIRAAIAELNVTREVEIHGVDLSRASLASMFARTVPLVRWLAEDSGGSFIAPGLEPAESAKRR